MGDVVQNRLIGINADMISIQASGLLSARRGLETGFQPQYRDKVNFDSKLFGTQKNQTFSRRWLFVVGYAK